MIHHKHCRRCNNNSAGNDHESPKCLIHQFTPISGNRLRGLALDSSTAVEHSGSSNQTPPSQKASAVPQRFFCVLFMSSLSSLRSPTIPLLPIRLLSGRHRDPSRCCYHCALAMPESPSGRGSAHYTRVQRNGATDRTFGSWEANCDKSTLNGKLVPARVRYGYEYGAPQLLALICDAK